MQYNKTEKSIRYACSRVTKEIYKVTILEDEEETYMVKDFDRYGSVHFVFKIDTFLEKKHAFLYKELSYI